MKHPKLIYAFTAILGIILLAMFLPNPLLFPGLNLFSYLYFSSLVGSGLFIFLMSCFFSIAGTVFLIAGLCGIRSHFRSRQNLSPLQPQSMGNSIVKHSKIYGLVLVVGIVFLGFFVAVWYLGENSAEVIRFFMSIPYSGLVMLIVFLLGGTSLLTVGVCGFVREHLRNNRNLLTVLAAISIPSLILVSFLYVTLSVALEVGL